MFVHREQNMKREDQQDAAIRCLLFTIIINTLTCTEVVFLGKSS